MTVTRTDHNQTFDPDGNLISEEFVEVDVTDTANTEQMILESSQAVDELVFIVDNLNAVTAMTHNEIDPVVLELIDIISIIARQTIRQARLTSGRIDDTHTGRTVWIERTT